MALPFYTIGLSTRTIEAFVHLLHTADVLVVADIRAIPRSRNNPQYNKDELPGTLNSFQIDYAHIPELGGRRNKTKTAPDERNGFWDNRSFQNYADYALTPAFQDGLSKLIALGRKQTCAMMCSEAVWWRCHRRIVSDHLLARGETVFHLMGTDKIDMATLTKGALVLDRSVTYPRVNRATSNQQGAPDSKARHG